MTNKKTVMQMFEEIRGLCVTDEQRAFIDKRMEITAKKNANRSGEPTPKQKEKMAQDAILREKVLSVMVEDATYTPTDLVKLVDTAEIPNTQKLTPLLTALVDAGVLTKETVKGRSVYSLSADSADEE